MECACEIYCDVDSDCKVKVLESRWVESKDPFKCCECGTQYESGKYFLELISSPDSTKIEKHITCPTCKNFRDVLFTDGWYYGEVCDDVCEFISEMDGDISEKCLLSLNRDTRIKLAEFIDYYWENNPDEDFD